MKFLFDLFPILLFFIAYKFFGIYTATAVAIAASFLQVGLFWLKHRRFETMHLITLSIIVVFGGLTLILRDSTFIKWKPTVVNWLFAVIFLASQFIGEKPLIQRMLDKNISLPAPIWTRLNLSWTLFFITLGCANLYVAFYYGLDLDAHTRENIWVNFKLIGMMGLTLVFIIGQGFYLSRHAKPVNDTDGHA